MKKRFNITGTCRANEHYMMDDRRRFNGIMEHVEYGDYFVMNRPRQYGKTTMLLALLQTLRRDSQYLPVLMNFQGLSVSTYESDISFGQFFFNELCYCLQNSEKFDKKETLATINLPKSMEDLSKKITQIVQLCPQKMVLLIDEVDAGSQYEPFLVLLGMLRAKFLLRDLPEHCTFHSVVLAGVHDIKSLKFKLRNPDGAQTNSPWNIAADFNVVMEFYPEEIIFMLKQYSDAENVQMNFEEIAEKLYFYTSGYPFLISKLCKTIAEEILPKKIDKSHWTLEDLEKSVQLLLKENNTNFDSLIKNLENNKDLYDLTYRILVLGESVNFNPDVPVARLGTIFGIFREDTILKIHNRIYQQRIYNYLIARKIEEKKLNSETVHLSEQFTDESGLLDVPKVLRKFQNFMAEHYSNRQKEWLEHEWRLIFLAFLKPILNGKGHDFKEVEISEEKRLDVVVTYLQQKHIIELKIWRGNKAHETGLAQLNDYLERQGVKKGYLLIFDNRKNSSSQEKIIPLGEKEIFAFWV
jgi:hypothetical protein